MTWLRALCHRPQSCHLGRIRVCRLAQGKEVEVESRKRQERRDERALSHGAIPLRDMTRLRAERHSFARLSFVAAESARSRCQMRWVSRWAQFECRFRLAPWDLISSARASWRMSLMLHQTGSCFGLNHLHRPAFGPGLCCRGESDVFRFNPSNRPVAKPWPQIQPLYVLKTFTLQLQPKWLNGLAIAEVTKKRRAR